jgi:hypothetical protein
MGSAVPLYLVTTAALTLRGSWKLTVSDVLLVIMRQALVGTSGAPGAEGKAQGSQLCNSFSKKCPFLFKGYPETHTMEPFVCTAW